MIITLPKFQVQQKIQNFTMITMKVTSPTNIRSTLSMMHHTMISHGTMEYPPTGRVEWCVCVCDTGHQVVPVTTYPIFIFYLPPTNELSATLHSPKTRSEDDNVGIRTTIALDSGSSIHIFQPDNKRSINV
jgi:hypothetical protein